MYIGIIKGKVYMFTCVSLVNSKIVNKKGLIFLLSKKDFKILFFMDKNILIMFLILSSEVIIGLIMSAK